LKQSLELADEPTKGYILNNMGMVNFYTFVAKSSEITDPQGAGLDALKPIIENFEDCIHHLKKSIHFFEQFEERFKSIQEAAENATEVDLALIKQKLFVDEMFSLKLGTG